MPKDEEPLNEEHIQASLDKNPCCIFTTCSTEKWILREVIT